MTAEAFSTTYMRRVLRFAVMVSPPGTDPEDVAQDVMVTALSRLMSDRGPRSVAPRCPLRRFTTLA
jgi:DNA-directed RNA polymerase specialized sigma24 family protein